MDNTIKKDKVKIQLRREVADKIKSKTKVGETYSDTIEKLLDK